MSEPEDHAFEYPASENRGDYSKQGFLMRTCPVCGHNNIFPADKIKVNCEKCRATLTISVEGETAVEQRTEKGG